MRNFKQTSAFVANKRVFVGIDVHHKQWSVCTYSDGEVVEKTRLNGSYKVLRSLLLRYKSARTIKCAYEAGFSGFWLCRKLRSAGYGCIVTPPSLTPRTGSKVKTDQRDAEKLAAYLAAGLLKSVWLPPEAVEADRRIVRRRSKLVKQRSTAKRRLQSFLHIYGLKRPASIKSNWSKAYIKWLSELEFAELSDIYYMEELLRDYARATEDVGLITKRLRALSQHQRYEKNFAIVTSARGVGLVTGMTLLLEIYDFKRFATHDKFTSYLGLTPSQHSSGENVRLGHITRYGNAELRRVLVESAWTAIRYDPILKKKYDRIRLRGANGKKAIVAVARTLAVRLRCCLLEQTEYVIGVC